jgi:PAS domain S-box-containing protein
MPDKSQSETKNGLHPADIQVRYQALFENAPIAISERDYSEFKKEFDALKSSGITNFKQYYRANPGKVLEHYNLSKMISFNPAMLKIHGGSNPQEITAMVRRSIKSGAEFWHVVFDILANLAEGNLKFSSRQLITTTSGEYKHIYITTSVAPGHEQTLSSVYSYFHDITDFSDSEAGYRSLVNINDEIGGSILMVQDASSQEGLIVFASDQFSQLTGYTKEEITGTDLFRYIAPPFRDTCIERHRRKIKGEALPGLSEIRIIHKNGSEIPVEITGTFSSYRGLPAMAVYLRDITERKTIEAQLIQEKNMAQHYLDIVNVIIVVMDTDFKITLINQKGCSILGYTQEELKGKRWDNFLPTEYRDEINLLLGKLFKQEIKPIAFHENPILTSSGQQRLISWHNSVIRDAQENITGLIASGIDITELRQAEQQIKEYQTNLEKTVTERTNDLEQTSRALAREVEWRKQSQIELRNHYQAEFQLRRQLEEQIKQRLLFTRSLVHELKTPLTPL